MNICPGGGNVTYLLRSVNAAPSSLGDKSADPHRAETLYARVFKRVLDLLLVLVAVPPVLAIVLPLALIIALRGGSPLYIQERVGRGGRIFRMWKLRTMVPDAEARLESHLENNPAARAEWDKYQKLNDDPRITRLGAFLRRSSIDELPQLWNVLRGDMAIVGPRPFMPSQQAIYPGSEYYRMTPGLTGLWQVSSRNEASFAQRSQFDTIYYRNLSLRTDLQLILRTLGVLMRPTGG